MKRKPKAVIAIFMLFLILSNFFMGVSIPLVEALTAGEVYDYSEEINDKIETVEGKITVSESNPLYLTDNSFKESVIYLKNTLGNYQETLNNQISTLDQGILLSDLITNYFSSKQVEYETYMINDTTIIDINDIKDITYNKLVEGVETQITLLTKTEIEDVIKSEFLNDVDTSITNLNTNYDTVLQSHQDSYNAILTNIDNYILDLNTKKTEIKNYVDAELLLLNNPTMTVNEVNIYDILDQAILDLENEKEGITISGLTIKNTNITTIKDTAIGKISLFWSYNKDYVELDIDSNISTVATNYDLAKTCLVNWFSDIDDYNDNNYNNYVNDLDTTLIDCYENIINIETNYNNLINKINTYLERKPSDETTINNLKEHLEEVRETVNQEKVLTHIDNIVELLQEEDEDTIDLLINFLSVTKVSTTTKDKIKTAKLRFYPLELKDSSTLKLTIKNNYILLDKVIGQLSLIDLSNDIDYGFNFDFTESELFITNDSKLNLYDRDNNLLISYDIIIKGDVDSDGNVDNDDVLSLKQQLLSIENPLEEQLDRLDINNDNLININDLFVLEKNILNINGEGETTNASFFVDRREENALVYYDIYLQTDGIVKGLQFNIDFSDDLSFNSYNTLFNDIVVNDINNPSKILGVGEYENNDLLITLVYNKIDDESLTQTEFKLLNIISIFDNYKTNTVNNLTNIYVKPVPEEVEVKEERVEVKLLSNIEEEKITTTSLQEPKELEKENEPLEKEITDKEIVWGNVVKIIIIVLLGTGIIYYLNKNDMAEETKKEELKKDNQKKQIK